MPVSAQTKGRLSSQKKILADLNCKFFMQHQNKKTSSAVKKDIIGQQAFLKKKCSMSAEKYQSGLLHDRYPLLSLQFNPWTKFAWCRLGKVRWASSCEASFLDLDGSCFLADVDCHFFRSISVNNIFLQRWANVFLAETKCRLNSHEKPSRSTL